MNDIPVAFLASPAASYLTGQLLVVDGAARSRRSTCWPDGLETRCSMLFAL